MEPQPHFFFIYQGGKLSTASSFIGVAVTHSVSIVWNFPFRLEFIISLNIIPWK